ncbi:MAG: succinate--CoA ligase subunit alpha [Bacillota bacterium]
MAVLIGKDTQVLIQGITGRQGNYHTLKMLEYGVRVVGGVTPGRGGQEVHRIPVFSSISEARERFLIDASMILVPPTGVLRAAFEAIENKIPLIVIITEFVPVHDVMIINSLARRNGCRVVGPNTIGLISPGKSKVGIMPGNLYNEGNVGIISRSGTLTHEISSNLTFNGMGQSTAIGIGGDPVKGMDFTDALDLFRYDGETESVIMIGEIGGTGEEEAARYIKETSYPKPVFAFIAGRTAPPEKKMGHAGAMVQKGAGTVQSKVKSLADSGVMVAQTLEELVQMVKSVD